MSSFIKSRVRPASSPYPLHLGLNEARHFLLDGIIPLLLSVCVASPWKYSHAVLKRKSVNTVGGTFQLVQVYPR